MLFSRLDNSALEANKLEDLVWKRYFGLNCALEHTVIGNTWE